MNTKAAASASSRLVVLGSASKLTKLVWFWPAADFALWNFKWDVEPSAASDSGDSSK